MSMNTVKTGIIYVRVSSKDQVENTSLESQEKACIEYAERNAITIIEPAFVEKGESAKSANRTEFQKAISRCADKKLPIKYFVVYKLDRFARNQDDHVTVRAILRRYGTELRSVTEPIDESSLGRAMEGMISVFAELDNNMRTERTRGGMLARIRQGIWCWQAPLGYYRPYKKANITPDEKIALYIRILFEEYAKGTYTYERLARFISDRGLRTKEGKKPWPQLMVKILKNEVYCGVIVGLGERIDGAFEPIVSRELFEQCRKIRLGIANGCRRSPENPLFPLRRIVVCTKCKQPLTGSRSRGKLGKYYHYYHHRKQGCVAAKSIPNIELEKIFLNYFQRIAPNDRFEKLFKAIITDTWKSSYKKLDENNSRIQKQIEVLATDRQRIFEFHQNGKYSDEEFQEQKRLINQRIEQKRILLDDSRIEEFDMELALNYCFEYLRAIPEKWGKTSDVSRKMRLRGLMVKGFIYFDGERIETLDMTEIHRVKQEYGGEKYHLVAPRGIEPRFPP